MSREGWICTRAARARAGGGSARPPPPPPPLPRRRLVLPQMPPLWVLLPALLLLLLLWWIPICGCTITESSRTRRYVPDLDEDYFIPLRPPSMGYRPGIVPSTSSHSLSYPHWRSPTPYPSVHASHAGPTLAMASTWRDPASYSDAGSQSGHRFSSGTVRTIPGGVSSSSSHAYGSSNDGIVDAAHDCGCAAGKKDEVSEYMASAMKDDTDEHVVVGGGDSAGSKLMVLKDGVVVEKDSRTKIRRGPSTNHGEVVIEKDTKIRANYNRPPYIAPPETSRGTVLIKDGYTDLNVGEIIPNDRYSGEGIRMVVTEDDGNYKMPPAGGTYESVLKGDEGFVHGGDHIDVGMKINEYSDGRTREIDIPGSTVGYKIPQGSKTYDGIVPAIAEKGESIMQEESVHVLDPASAHDENAGRSQVVVDGVGFGYKTTLGDVTYGRDIEVIKDHGSVTHDKGYNDEEVGVTLVPKNEYSDGKIIEIVKGSDGTYQTPLGDHKDDRTIQIIKEGTRSFINEKSENDRERTALGDKHAGKIQTVVHVAEKEYKIPLADEKYSHDVRVAKEDYVGQTVDLTSENEYPHGQPSGIIITERNGAYQTSVGEQTASGNVQIVKESTQSILHEKGEKAQETTALRGKHAGKIQTVVYTAEKEYKGPPTDGTYTQDVHINKYKQGVVQEKGYNDQKTVDLTSGNVYSGGKASGIIVTERKGTYQTPHVDQTAGGTVKIIKEGTQSVIHEKSEKAYETTPLGGYKHAGEIQTVVTEYKDPLTDGKYGHDVHINKYHKDVQERGYAGKTVDLTSGKTYSDGKSTGITVTERKGAYRTPLSDQTTGGTVKIIKESARSVIHEKTGKAHETTALSDKHAGKIETISRVTEKEHNIPLTDGTYSHVHINKNHKGIVRERGYAGQTVDLTSNKEYSGGKVSGILTTERKGAYQYPDGEAHGKIVTDRKQSVTHEKGRHAQETSHGEHTSNSQTVVQAGGTKYKIGLEDQTYGHGSGGGRSHGHGHGHSHTHSHSHNHGHGHGHGHTTENHKSAIHGKDHTVQAVDVTSTNKEYSSGKESKIQGREGDYALLGVQMQSAKGQVMKETHSITYKTGGHELKAYAQEGASKSLAGLGDQADYMIPFGVEIRNHDIRVIRDHKEDIPREKDYTSQDSDDIPSNSKHSDESENQTTEKGGGSDYKVLSVGQEDDVKTEVTEIKNCDLREKGCADHVIGLTTTNDDETESQILVTRDAPDYKVNFDDQTLDSEVQVNKEKRDGRLHEKDSDDHSAGKKLEKGEGGGITKSIAVLKKDAGDSQSSLGRETSRRGADISKDAETVSLVKESEAGSYGGITTKEKDTLLTTLEKLRENTEDEESEITDKKKRKVSGENDAQLVVEKSVATSPYDGALKLEQADKIGIREVVESETREVETKILEFEQAAGKKIREVEQVADTGIEEENKANKEVTEENGELIDATEKREVGKGEIIEIKGMHLEPGRKEIELQEKKVIEIELEDTVLEQEAQKYERGVRKIEVQEEAEEIDEIQTLVDEKAILINKEYETKPPAAEEEEEPNIIITEESNISEYIGEQTKRNLEEILGSVSDAAIEAPTMEDHKDNVNTHTIPLVIGDSVPQITEYESKIPTISDMVSESDRMYLEGRTKERVIIEESVYDTMSETEITNENGNEEQNEGCNSKKKHKHGNEEITECEKERNAKFDQEDIEIEFIHPKIFPQNYMSYETIPFFTGHVIEGRNYGKKTTESKCSKVTERTHSEIKEDKDEHLSSLVGDVFIIDSKLDKTKEATEEDSSARTFQTGTVYELSNSEENTGVPANRFQVYMASKFPTESNNLRDHMKQTINLHIPQSTHLHSGEQLTKVQRQTVEWPLSYSGEITETDPIVRMYHQDNTHYKPLQKPEKTDDKYSNQSFQRKNSEIFSPPYTNSKESPNYGQDTDHRPSISFDQSSSKYTQNVNIYRPRSIYDKDISLEAHFEFDEDRSNKEGIRKERGHSEAPYSSHVGSSAERDVFLIEATDGEKEVPRKTCSCKTYSRHHRHDHKCPKSPSSSLSDESLVIIPGGSQDSHERTWSEEDHICFPDCYVESHPETSEPVLKDDLNILELIRPNSRYVYRISPSDRNKEPQSDCLPADGSEGIVIKASKDPPNKGTYSQSFNAEDNTSPLTAPSRKAVQSQVPYSESKGSFRVHTLKEDGEIYSADDTPYVLPKGCTCEQCRKYGDMEILYSYGKPTFYSLHSQTTPCQRCRSKNVKCECSPATRARQIHAISHHLHPPRNYKSFDGGMWRSFTSDTARRVQDSLIPLVHWGNHRRMKD